MLDLIVLRIRLFQHRLGLWPPTRTVSVQATLASRRPCAVLTSLSVSDLLPRRACAARRAQWGAERPSRICEHLVVNRPLVPSTPVLRPSALDGRLARPPARGPCESARKEHSNALLPTSDRCGDGRQHHFAARRTCENHALAGPLGCALFSTCLPTSPIASV